MKLAIREYVTPQGTNPFREWLRNLDMVVQALSRRECCDLKAAISAITKVWAAGSGKRLDFGPGYRLYFGKDGVAVVLLLAGGDKGSQSKDIAAAKRYWQDFREAKHGKAQ